MLQLGLYDSPGGALITDLTHRASNVRWSSGEHGCHDLTCFVAMPLWEAFALYDRPGTPHVQVTGPSGVVWAGRLEDPALSFAPGRGGVRLTAFGYWRALSDVRYTALWSTTRVADWVPVRVDDDSSYEPSRFEMDTNNRLYIALRKGESHSTSHRGALTYETPDASVTQILYVTFDYELKASATYSGRLSSATRAFGSAASEWTLAGDGTTQTGSATITLANARDRIWFSLFTGGGATTYSGETGDTYLKITNLRVKKQVASNHADFIAYALVAYVNAVNSAQFSSSTALILSPALDLTDEVYEDQFPADILTRLASLGDNQTPPRQWEAVVWDDRILRFQPKGTDSQTYYVDITALELERSLNLLRNAAYAVYQDANGRRLRTDVAVNQASIDRYGLTRRNKVDVQTSSSTQAATHRDAYLEDNADPKPQALIEFDRIYNAAGDRVPNWLPRAGDSIVIRNLPPTLSVDIDRIRTFRASFARYDADVDRIGFRPEAALPSLDVLVARIAAGIR